MESVQGVGTGVVGCKGAIWGEVRESWDVACAGARLVWGLCAVVCSAVKGSRCERETYHFATQHSVSLHLGFWHGQGHHHGWGVLKITAPLLSETRPILRLALAVLWVS